MCACQRHLLDWSAIYKRFRIAPGYSGLALLAIFLIGLGNPLACLLHSALSDLPITLNMTATQAAGQIQYDARLAIPPGGSLAFVSNEKASDCLPCHDHETPPLLTIAVFLRLPRVMPLILPILPWQAVGLFLRPITYPPPRHPPRRRIG